MASLYDSESKYHLTEKLVNSIRDGKGALAIQALLLEGADIDARDSEDNSIVLVACSQGRKIIVDLLIKAGANLNRCDADGYTALHYSSSYGWTDTVRSLVKKGVNLDASDVRKETALHHASRRGHLNVVKCLLEEGADIERKNCEGCTPMLCAGEYSRRDSVELLLDLGANVNATTQTKFTILHYASANGWIETVQSIVKRGCDLDARNVYGITALGDACMTQKLTTVQYLLQAGASCNITDQDGNLPLNYITRVRIPEFKFIKLLIEKGAYFNSNAYDALVMRSFIKVLQDVELCCQAVVNKFNNHDLPELYRLYASRSLPCIEKMKIVSESEIACAIERNVKLEIQTKGHCNVLEVRPMVLSLFSVRSILEYYKFVIAEPVEMDMSSFADFFPIGDQEASAMTMPEGLLESERLRHF